jgi:integrase/recombinase XerC
MSDLAAFSQYLHESGLKVRTVRAYVSDAARYITWCEQAYGMAFSASMLNRSDLHDYQVQCRKQERIKAATWNRYVASLAVFAAWLGVSIDGVLTRADAQKLAPKSLDKSEYRRFRLAVIEATRTAKTEAAKRQALRNAVVITLLADAGMREGEVVHLRVQDVLLGERKGRVIVCDAKGNKDRTIPIDKDSVDMIKAWLAVRPDPDSTEALLVGKFGESLQERGIQKLVARIAQDARIDHVTPHQLRHTAAYRWRESGADLVQIAALLGHSSIEVTRRYTLPHYSDLEEIVEVA